MILSVMALSLLLIVYLSTRTLINRYSVVMQVRAELERLLLPVHLL